MPKISYHPPFNTQKVKNIVDWFLVQMELSNEEFSLNIKGGSVPDFAALDESRKNSLAFIYFYEEKEYEMLIKKSLLACSPHLFLEIIFEELVHVYQFLKEGLQYCRKTEKWNYANETFPKDIPYDSSPWEINAKAWAQKLTQSYLNQTNL